MKHSEILKKYAIAPKKALGQNFLVNDGILDAIASIIGVEGAQVVEVWPGYGALTERLLAHSPESLTLVEYDRDMVRILEERVVQNDLVVPEWTMLQIEHQDVLDFQPAYPAFLIANIPYYITSPILFRFLYEVEHRPKAMVILMQREVADKIRATKAYGNSYLSLAMENACDSISEAFRVAPGSFIPPPKVESSVLVFSVREQYVCPPKELLPVLSAAFAHPRKKVLSNLLERSIASRERLESIFSSLGIRLDARAEQIPLVVWKEILVHLHD